MRNRIVAYIQEKQMIEQGDGVIAGVSGGADSVCLLFILKDIASQWGLNLCVVHIEHGIRGEDSLADAKYVEALCEKLDLPFALYQYPVEEYAKEHGLTVEEAGRVLRYQSFEREAEKMFAQKIAKVRIAVAHNANDNAETMLFHLARGTGIDGLCGIPSVRKIETSNVENELTIIRPLLSTTREEIEEYLAGIAQSYRTDKTNFEMEYDRNKIRHEILPVLDKINEQALSHITRETDELQEMADYLTMQAKEVLEKICMSEQAIDRKLLASYPKVLQKEVLHLWISRFANHGKDITNRHIMAALNLVEGQVGREVYLPYQLKLYADYLYLNLYRMPSEESAGNDIRDTYNHPAKGIELKIEEIKDQGVHSFTFGNVTFGISVEEWNISCAIPQKIYTKCFDYDKIKSNLEIRNRRAGDFLEVGPQGRSKKFKNYCINEKIPKNQRDDVILLCEGHHVLWAVGYRISEKYKVEDSTTKILKVQIMEEKEQ